MAADWNAEKMIALGHLHAQLEAERKLDPLMDTLVAEPDYEFHPLGLAMRGGESTRRYYAQFFMGFMNMIVGYELLDEWANERAVVQEYDITVNPEGEPETHRVLGILFAEGDRLGGERIHASERCVRLMCGPLFDELEPLR